MHPTAAHRVALQPSSPRIPALSLLGTPRILVDDVPVALVARRGTLRVIAAIAVRSRSATRQARSDLARLLWPDAPRSTAFANLRRHLNYFESGLERVGVATPIQRRGDALSLDTVRIWIDVWAFERALDDDELEPAVNAFGGDFLIDDDDDWVVAERARLATLRNDALERLFVHARARDDVTAASRWGTALLEGDPYREDIVRDLMRTRMLLGDGAGAVAIYSNYADRLRRDFGVDPSAETRAFAGRVVTSVPSQQTRFSDVTAFFGRERELAALGDLIRRQAAVTLVGPPGVGKTRLAHRAADLFGGRFSDGVLGVDLTEVSENDSVIAAIERAAAAQLSADGEARTIPLSQRDLLLILDNCEHVRTGSARVVRSLLRERAPWFRILATSRVPLGIPGEVTSRVEPLPVPHPSVDLFLDRAYAARPDVDFGAAPDVIEEVCLRLDGLPLALELAAARLRTMSLAEVHARLSDRFRLLHTEGHGDRHDALRAAFDDSYRELTTRDRVLLRTLALFAGPWTIEAAAAVAGEPEWTVIDGLRRLVDASLVSPPRGSASSVHYSMLQSLREYVRSADDVAPANDAAKRLARYYGKRLVERSDVLNDQAALDVFDEVDADLPNIRVALTTLLDEELDLELGARACIALLRFWYVRGHVVEAESRLATIIGSERLASATQLSVLHAYAVVVRNQFDYRRAFELFSQARDLADQNGESARAAIIGIHMAECARVLGDYARANAIVAESTPALEAAGDWYVVGYASCELGLIAVDCGELEEALTHFDAAYQRFEETQAAIDLVVVDANRTTALARLGRLEEAAAVGRAALARSQQHNVRFVEASLLVSLAYTALKTRDEERAKRDLALAIGIARELSDFERFAEICETAAELASERDADGAAALVGAGEALRERCGARGGILVARERGQLTARLTSAIGVPLLEAKRREGRQLSIDALTALVYRLLR